MLVLSRDPTKTIRIAEEITITVVRANEFSVTLAIEAPSNVIVARSEIYESFVDKKEQELNKFTT